MRDRNKMNEVNFLLISDPKIWAMQVQDCGEQLVDLGKLNYQIKLERASFYDGYTKVRESVVKKLNEARELLPQGFDFFFSEGHRPITLQNEMYNEYYAHLAAAHPDWDDAKLKIETSKYVAPAKDVPPHSTGGAIDITLIDANGNEVDMGSILDETPDKNENRNFTYAKNITETARTNRGILINALQQVGFVNYPAEWWHWSYGDKYWAYHAKQSHAIYASIEA